MSLDRETIESNKEFFISELKKVTREGADIDALIDMLEHSNFFYAPASTVYHCAFEGGLCHHSINVLDNLKRIVNMKVPQGLIPEESIIITALLHDISKFDFYEQYTRNEKVYSLSGDKKDNMGTFSWVAKTAYKVADSTKRFVFGTHGQNSHYIISQYIPLDTDESAAILNHMGQSNDAAPDLTAIYNRYPLACLLHVADMLATYIDEPALADAE